MINFFKQLFSTNPDAKEEENFNLTYLDSRLEEINNKLDDTEYRIDDLEGKDFDDIEYRIENLEGRDFDDIEYRIENLEGQETIKKLLKKEVA
jgi:predicted  nucleic acid-binding Zn-ribbon protein